MDCPVTENTDNVAIPLLLAKLGGAMIASGQPAHEIEQELVEVGARLGYAGLQVGVAPTGLVLSLRSGDPATYESVGGPIGLDKASEVRRIRHQLVASELAPGDALGQLLALRDQPSLYASWIISLAWVLVSCGIALILQPGWANLALVAVCSGLVYALLKLAKRTPLVATLLPTISAFLVTAIVYSVAGLGWIEGPLRTVLPALAPLLPGAVMVTAMSELAAGHMQAGASRLAYGTVQLGLFGLGLVAALTILNVPTELMLNERIDDIGWWGIPVGLVVLAIGICLIENIALSVSPWVLLVLLMAFGAQSGGHALGSAALGGFFGAIAANFGAAVCESLRPRLVRLVLFLPAFWLLVPGSLGLIGVTTLVAAPDQAMTTGLEVLVVICAIALGLLVGSAVGLAIRRRGDRSR